MAASAREDGPFAHCVTELVPKPMRCTARSDYPEGGRKTSLYRAYEAEEARSPRVARPHRDQRETPEKDSEKDEGVDVEQRAEGPAPETESAASLLSQARSSSRIWPASSRHMQMRRGSSSRLQGRGAASVRGAQG